MSRPLIQHKIGQLEALFASSTADVNVLKQLEHELQYRQVPKALALLANVQAALGEAALGKRSGDDSVSISSTNKPPETTARQLELIDQTAITLPRAELPPIQAPTRVPPHSIVPETQPDLTMPVSEAYKLLRVAVGASWCEIELARRHVVQQSHPLRMASLTPGMRAKHLAEAQRVNVASTMLWRDRTGSNN